MRRFVLAIILLLSAAPAFAQGSAMPQNFPVMVAPAFASAIASLTGCSTTGTVLVGGTPPSCTATPSVTSLGLGVGSAVSPALFFTANPGTGIWTNAGDFNFVTSNQTNFTVAGSQIQGTSAMRLNWSASSTNSDSSPDTGFSRLGAASVALGNGTAGDFSGTLKLATLNATTAYQLNGTAGVGFALTKAQPADQTARSSATFVQMGLGAAAAPCTITPTSTGRVVFTISGDIVNNTNATTVTINLSEGTGSAPANNAAATGTVISAAPVLDGLTSALSVPFSVTSIQTGLALATAVWFDLQLKTSGANTGGSTNITCVAHEI